MLNWLSRYAFVLDFIDKIQLRSPVLEVGSGPYGIGYFTKEPFVGVDIQFKSLPKAPMVPLLGHAAFLPFHDGTFRMVVLADVLEHVPQQVRFQVLREALRVSSEYCFVTFPSGSAAHDADRQFAAWYEGIGPVPDWIEDHRSYGLPSKSEFEGYISRLPEARDWECLSVPGENAVWHLILTVIDHLPRLGDRIQSSIQSQVREWVRLCQQASFGEPYRVSYLFVRKSPRAPLLDRMVTELDVIKCLACPTCKRGLLYSSGRLSCPWCGLVFGRLEGIWDLRPRNGATTSGSAWEELKRYLGHRFDPRVLENVAARVDEEFASFSDPREFYRSSVTYLYDLTSWDLSGAKARGLQVVCALASKEDTILDYGCGIGADGIRLLGQGFSRVSFADFSSPSTEYLRWRLNQRGYQARVFDIERDAIPQHDLVFSFDVIEHVADAEGFLRRLEALGRTVVVTFLLTPPNKKADVSYPEYYQKVHDLIADINSRYCVLYRGEYEYRDATQRLRYVLLAYRPSNEPFLSVIIATRNRAAILEKCLQSLVAQTLDKRHFEVVVVDDGSRDGTSEVAKRFEGDLHVRFLRQSHRGLAAARNLGIRESKGFVVLFVNDDTFLEQNALMHHYNFHLSHPEYWVAMVGHVDWHKELRMTPLMRYVTEAGGHQFDFGRLTPGRTIDHWHFYGSCSSVKRSFLLRTGMYDETFQYAWDDIELAYRLMKAGLEAYYNPEAREYHYHPIDIGYFFERQKQCGYMAVAFARKHPELARFLIPGFPRISTDGFEEVPSLFQMAADLEAEASSSQTRQQQLYAVYGKLLDIAYRMGAQEAMKSPESAASVETSIVIPVYNSWEYTRRCLKKLEDTGVPKVAEVIVVDNGSSDETATQLSASFPWVRVIRNQSNEGFAAACNKGAALASGRYLIFLNNDTEVCPGWLEKLLEPAKQDERVAIVGSKLLFPDGRIQHAGVEICYAAPFPITPAHIRYGDRDEPPESRREVDAVTGASMLVKRDIFLKVGGFDERYRNGYEDVDLCLKVKQMGYKVVYEPGSVAIHYGSVTPGRHTYERENLAMLHRQWMPLVRTLRVAPRHQKASTSRPRVSVIVVTYNSFATVAPCVESILSTLQPGDEVIVVDNGSRDETGSYLEVVAEQEPDDRFKLILSKDNMGYSAAAAKAARIAGNSFLVFVNPDAVVFDSWIDELLAPMLADGSVAATGPVSNYAAGLQNVASYIQASDQAETISDLTRRLRDRWRGQHIDTPLLIGFCLAVRRSALEQVGGLDETLFLGNDDLDISWRLRQAGYRLVVVPSVFVFHHGQASFRSEPAPKTTYLVQQSTNQLYEKLHKFYAGAVPTGQDLWGIGWFKPHAELLSIIVPVHTDPWVTRRCLESILRHTYRPFELIIIDNASDAETKQVVSEFRRALNNVVVIENHENYGYPVACNQGVSVAKGEYLVIMNNDVVVTPHWASRLLAAFSVDPKIGAVGPRTNFCAGPQMVSDAEYSEETLDQWAEQWHRKNAGSLRTTNRLIGFLIVAKRELVEQIGGFDPLFGIGNFEDDDWSLRALLAGYKLVIADDVFVHHYGSRSFRTDAGAYARLLDVNRQLFAAKWSLRFQNGAYDPTEVLQRGSYRRHDLYIPLSMSSIFSPDLEPLEVGTNAPRRLLCVPDPSDTGQVWLECVMSYLTKPGGNGDTALIVRVEPTDEEWLHHVVGAIERAAKERGLDVDSRDDLVIEATKLPSSERGRVYRAATDFIALPGVRKESLVREAMACGLRIVAPANI